ncbi:hypothetical protein GCM10010911_46090 [Paenibacillus nasutitermitis]|uniref:Uncharacterized protein n=1 Tax=Paenibacillus nasutitermitis TaxID=1652958 RepID=A0A916Z9C9_9BACL|nr:hypothetical protein GCM10010911_46090 [Paenibacillus nasutitermitis]
MRLHVTIHKHLVEMSHSLVFGMTNVSMRLYLAAENYSICHSIISKMPASKARVRSHLDD